MFVYLLRSFLHGGNGDLGAGKIWGFNISLLYVHRNSHFDYEYNKTRLSRARGFHTCHSGLAVHQLVKGGKGRFNAVKVGLDIQAYSFIPKKRPSSGRIIQGTVRNQEI